MGFCPSTKLIEKAASKMVCGRGSLYKVKSAGRNDGVESVNDGQKGSNNGSKKIRGNVVLMKKNVLDFNDVPASLLDRFLELVGKGVSLQLISADQPDPGHPLSLSESGAKFSGNIDCSREVVLAVTSQ